MPYTLLPELTELDEGVERLVHILEVVEGEGEEGGHVQQPGEPGHALGEGGGSQGPKELGSKGPKELGSKKIKGVSSRKQDS